MKEQKVLEESGLSEKESKAYLCLLTCGQATATRVSRETGIERVHVYSILNKLKEKGLATHHMKNNVKYFSAGEPRKLLEDIRQKERKLAAIMASLEQIKQSKAGEIMVEVYDGREGLKATLDDFFAVGQTIYVLGEQGQFQQMTPDLAVSYRKRLEKYNIKEKILITEEFKDKLIKAKTTEVRCLPKDVISPSTTLIYGDRVCISIVTKSQIFNVVIKSSDIADSYRGYFNYMWSIARE